MSLEHNMVCWGAQSYCHVKGVGEQGVGAAQCWQSTCLQTAMRFEEGDVGGRSSKPQHSLSPQGQRLPVQCGPLEGPLPDASSQVSSGPRSPGDRARPPAPVLWGDGPAPTADGVPSATRWLPEVSHRLFQPPWESPHTASANLGCPIRPITRTPLAPDSQPSPVSASVTARWSLVCPLSLEPVPQKWGAANHKGGVGVVTMGLA